MVDQEDLSKIGEVLWDLFTNEVPDQSEEAQLAKELDGAEDAQASEELELLRESLLAIHEAGVDNVSSEDLQSAIEQLSESMTVQQQAQLQPLREALANQPPQVIQQAGDNVTVVRNVTEVTEVTNVTNVEEGDQIVDQSVNTTILAEGDVDFDQEIANTANVGDDGAVVVGGDVEDSAVNTGEFDGVQGGGDVSIEDSAIGDANVLVNDSEFDALAVGGDATAVEAGGNANVGSGTQVDIDAGGDVASAVGDSNDLTGDQTANIGAAPEPAPEPEPEPFIEDTGIEEAMEMEVQADLELEDAAIELDA